MTKILNTFNVLRNKPIDTRYVKDTISDRNNIPSAYRYDGLKVYVKSEKVEYIWDDTISDWKIYWEFNPITLGTGNANYLAYFSTNTTLTSSNIYYNNNRIGISTNNPRGSIHIGNSDGIIIDDVNKSIMYNTYFDSLNRSLVNNKGSVAITFIDDKIKLSARVANSSGNSYNDGVQFGLSSILSNPITTQYNRNYYLALNNNSTYSINSIVQIHSRENSVLEPISIGLVGTNTTGFIGLNTYMPNDVLVNMFDSTKNAGGLFISDKIKLLLKNNSNTLVDVINIEKVANSFKTTIIGTLYSTIDYNINLINNIPALGLNTNSLRYIIDYFNSNIDSINDDIVNINNILSSLSTPTNIYTSSGVLTGNRQVNLNNYSLEFLNGNFGIRLSNNNTFIYSENTFDVRTNTLNSHYVRLDTRLLTDVRVIRFPDKNGILAIVDDILQSDWNETNTLSKSFILNKPDIGNNYTAIYVDSYTTSSIYNGTISFPFINISQAIDYIIGNGTAEAPEIVNAVIYVKKGEYSINTIIELCDLTIVFDKGCLITVNSNYMFSFTETTNYKLNLIGYADFICDSLLLVNLPLGYIADINMEINILNSPDTQNSLSSIFSIQTESESFFSLKLNNRISSYGKQIFNIQKNVNASIEGNINSKLEIYGEFSDANLAPFYSDLSICYYLGDKDSSLKMKNLSIYKTDQSSNFFEVLHESREVYFENLQFYPLNLNDKIEYLINLNIEILDISLNFTNAIMKDCYVSGHIIFRNIDVHSWTSINESFNIINNSITQSYITPINCHVDYNDTGIGHIAYYMIGDTVPKSHNFFGRTLFNINTYTDNNDAIDHGLIEGDFYIDPNGFLKVIV